MTQARNPRPKGALGQARTDDEVRMYKAPPPEVSTEAFYETDPAKPYRRGFSVQTVSPLPIVWAGHITAAGHWGADLRAYMRDHPHWAVLGALCEFLPQSRNRVTVEPSQTDRHGIPVARGGLRAPARRGAR